MGSVSTIFQTIVVDLFIGIQSMVWVLLGILLVIGDLRMPVAGSFKGLGDIGTLMIVAFMYSFGTIVVRLSDSLASLVLFRKKSRFFHIWMSMTPDGSLLAVEAVSFLAYDVHTYIGLQAPSRR